MAASVARYLWPLLFIFEICTLFPDKIALEQKKIQAALLKSKKKNTEKEKRNSEAENEFDAL